MREDRWQHLVHAAELLDAPGGTDALQRQARLRALLGSLLEVFPSALDPVDDFEAWAVRRFAQALARSLEAGSDVG